MLTGSARVASPEGAKLAPMSLLDAGRLPTDRNADNDQRELR